MTIPMRHIMRQGPVFRTLLSTLSTALHPPGERRAPSEVSCPGPELSEVVSPRHPALIRDYLRYLGTSPSAYQNAVPPHLFPQWGFPILAKTLRPLPYNLTRIVNAGTEFDLRHPLPAGEPLRLKARLEECDDNGVRAILRQRLTTGTRDHDDALVVYVTAIIPLKQGGGTKKPKSDEKSEPVRVPEGTRELALLRWESDAGLKYATLTGDFNPVHWLPQYARLAGYNHSILHGFSGAASVFESLRLNLFTGTKDTIKLFNIRFRKPITLPRRLKLFINDSGQFFVGSAILGPAYFTGNYI